MPLCTDRTVVNENEIEGTISTLRCKRWSCEYCNPGCRRRVIEKARDGNPNIFLTLTWNTNRPETPDQAARAMKHAFVVLRRRMASKLNIVKVPFIVVFEKTKKGFPHMHILLRSKFISQEWLSEQMADLIDAPIVDIRKIKDRKMAYFYVTKYLGKDLAAFANCKRWWRSHNYEVERDEDVKPFIFGHGFKVEAIDYHTMLAKLMRGDPEIIEQRRGFTHFRRRMSLAFDPTRPSYRKNIVPLSEVAYSDFGA